MRVILSRIREARNLTQQAVADAANISQGHYNYIESGKSRPSPRVAERIAQVLSIKKEDIFAVFYGEGA